MEKSDTQAVSYNTGKTTVVIPNFNGLAFLQDCLSSLGNVPIIVVDNGSMDESVDFIKEHYPHVTLICNEENKGFCTASNQGMEAVETPYVFLLNNDTKVDPACITKLEECMESDEKIFSVQAKMLQMAHPELIDDAGDFYCALGWAYARGKGKTCDKYSKRDQLFASCGGAVLYRKEYLKITGVFDEAHFAYLEDIDLGYRARIKGLKNLIEPEAIVYHVGSGASGSRHNKFKVDLSSRNNVYLFCKNMPLLQFVINIPFLLLGILVKWLFFVRKKLGKAYIQGVLNGLKLSFSKQGRAKHVAFKFSNLGHYCRIQLELWWNIFRMFA